MNAKNGWGIAIALLTVGCAARVQPEVRFPGASVPSAWIERAEKGSDTGERISEWTQAQACVAVSRKLREADSLESLRFLRKGAELRDGECCRQYLALIEGSGITHSQRLYGRLFIEGLLRQGAIRTASGSDVTLDLQYQLCWAWRCAEPRSDVKARGILAAMVRRGLTPEMARSEFLRDLMRPDAANESDAWLQIVSNDPTISMVSGDGSGRWGLMEGTAWAGGSDKLLFATGVLAFLVNERGEPSFRGRQLWIRNCGTAPVYVTSAATGRANHELLPGAEELWPAERQALDDNQCTTGIALKVRFRPVR